MSDNRHSRAGNRHRQQLEAARAVGGWMPWAAAFVALAGWAGVGAWLYVTMGLPALMALPPAQLAGAAAVIITPGIALICAGIMARESQRSSAANAVVLSAARQLLEPAESAREDVASLAEAVAEQSAAVNRAMADTRGRMEGLRKDLETSVTQALKAAEIVRTDSEVLIGKMAAERQSLMQVSEALKAQAEHLTRAIPRHAESLSTAARSAQEEVKRADETLDTRLREVESAARNLAERIAQLDSMGSESRKRAQTMATALSSMEEQLMRSTRMVDQAVKAGELAVAGSKNTADALRDAMSASLDAALKTSETIATRATEASDSARDAMGRLKDAGLQAEATTRAAAHAARMHADETEARINQLSEFLFRAANNASNAAADGFDRARERIERASTLVAQMRSDQPHEPTSIDDLLLEPEAPAATEHLRQPPEQRRASTEDFHVAMREAGAPPEVLTSIARTNTAPPTPAPAPEAKPQANAWKELISSVDDDVSGPPAKREETAQVMLDQLGRAGVKLNHAVRATDLRRIAHAAHQGERQRRRATRDQVPSEISKVARLLDSDPDLIDSARAFCAAEEPHALKTLAGSNHAREDAAPRLSAYLLLDAALGVRL